METGRMSMKVPHVTNPFRGKPTVIQGTVDYSKVEAKMAEHYVSKYQLLKEQVRDLYRELNTGDDDRAEKRLCGTNIQLRRTVINCKTSYILEYQGAWGWTRTRVDELTEYLWKRREAT